MLDYFGNGSCQRLVARGDRSMKAIALIIVGIGLCACGPQNDVINYRTYTDPERGIFYIYDGVLDKGELISGVGNDQQKVVITRQQQAN